MDALAQVDINERLSNLTGWEFKNDMITRTYKLDSYMAGLAFASAVGTIAEAHNHHPDMTIGWRKVTVSLTTHDAGSKVTDKDFTVAEAVQALGYPKEG